MTVTDSLSPNEHPFAGFFKQENPDSTQEQPLSRRAARARRVTHPYEPPKSGLPPKKSRRWLKILIVLIILFGILGGAATGIYFTYQVQINRILGIKAANDFEGTGTGEKVTVVIAAGDLGDQIGDKLAAAGVIKTSQVFYSLLLAQPKEVVFLPGSYSLSKGMSAQAALTALEDPANKIEYKVTIPEGSTSAGIFAELNKTTGVPLADLQAAAQDLPALGITPAAPNIEGYLFPATYTFEPNTSAHDMLKIMVDRAFVALDAAGVAPANREKVLILASIIQKEARLPDDFGKVSRVFTNRIEQGMLLQSDATVAYGTGQKRVDTTSAERNDKSNLYNTYQHEGLPIGPISNPGEVAIKAALNPTPGKWIYFVTWNLETGETIFSTTQREHEAGVKKYQEWSAANPDYIS